MQKLIGIRREDKSIWERRVSLTPNHVKELKTEAFANGEYNQKLLFY